jgi:hypothetical protein
MKVDSKAVTAQRVAWELAHGQLPPGTEVRACPEDRACVRIEHLAIRRPPSGRRGTAMRSGSRGGGSKVEVRPGVWKLSVSAGRFDDGSVRRVHRTVRASTAAESARLLAEFVTEVHNSPLPDKKAERDFTIDEAPIERFLTEYLLGEKGRDPGTVRNYRGVHARWFSPEIGGRRVVGVDEAPIDRIFGWMRTAGLSASRLHDARNLYQPFFRWAKRRGIIRRSPMVDFELPTSSHVTTEHTPPEVDQLCPYLQLLEPLVRRVVVSSLRKTRAIAEAKVKSDKVDARNLAQLMAANFLPSVWLPDDRTRMLGRRSPVALWVVKVVRVRGHAYGPRVVGWHPNVSGLRYRRPPRPLASLGGVASGVGSDAGDGVN